MIKKIIELISNENENDLTPIQKIAQQAFIYDSELQNGGHLQYFENQFQINYSEVIKSLKITGALKQSEILQIATRQFLGKQREKIIDKQEFIEAAIDEEYKQFDDEY